MNLNKKSILKILLIIFASILFYVLLQNVGTTATVIGQILRILAPFILGLCMAFIFNVPMRFLETKLFAKTAKKHPKIWRRLHRPLCLTLSIFIILAVLTVFLLLIIPEIRQTVITVAEGLPEQVEALSNTLKTWADRFNISYEEFDLWDVDWNTLSSTLLDSFQDGGKTVIRTTIDFTSGVVNGVVNLVLGFAFSIYILASKDKLTVQVKKLAYAILPEKAAAGIFRITSLANGIFTHFVIGQCTEALILGALCYMGMLIFNMPYAMLISSLIAVTALVPLFGAFIGTAVGALMILLQSPIQALWFVLFIIVLQQLESNIIYPKVVGNSVGLPGIWVLFSVTAGGSSFGIAGMLVSVPLCAVIYCLLREFVDKRLDVRHINGELFDRRE